MSDTVTRYHHLPDTPGSAGLARTHVRAFLFAHNLPHLYNDAALLTSELVTNALLHAPGPPELRLELRPDALRLEVLDTSPKFPTLRPPTPDSLSGRGLLLVESLAAKWGVTSTSTHKSVWCELPLPQGSPMSGSRG